MTYDQIFHGRKNVPLKAVKFQHLIKPQLIPTDSVKYSQA